MEPAVNNWFGLLLLVVACYLLRDAIGWFVDAVMPG
jgi:hypothetical protein